MRTINIHEAKTHLSRIVEEVAGGESVVIAKAGKPIAKIVPLAKDASRRTLGILHGKIEISPDFDAELPAAVLDGFEG